MVSDPTKQEKKLKKSHEYRDRAQRVIPTGTQTFSKAPTAFVQGVSPVFLERGSGSRVYDVDGNEYIDYILGLGPVILGYNYPEVVDAVQRQLDSTGSPILSLPHPLEIELAELLVGIIPCAEMVRFGKNGSDATSGAVRLARAFTGRDVIAYCGYHGWQDWYVGATTRARGVPDCYRALTLEFEYNNLDSLKRVFEEHPDRVAGVIMEPMGAKLPKSGFLEGIRDLTHRHGALLIFDEVITGFRFTLGGAQEHFDVVPDLACFGKAMANGFPLSALVGRRDVMQLLEDVFFSFTFGGEILSIAASLATIQVMREHPVFEHIWHLGKMLQDGFNQLSVTHDTEDFVRCVGLPPRSVIQFNSIKGIDSSVLKSFFQQEVIRRGILFNGNQFISFSHNDDDVQQTLDVYDEALALLVEGVEHEDVEARLVGQVVQPVFHRP